MDKKLKAKWVKALRSGKYRQAQEVMRSEEGGYCCLGVLRSIMHPGSHRKMKDIIGGSDIDMLCKEHQSEAGLTKRNQSVLAAKNDRGETFAKIADYIAKKL